MLTKDAALKAIRKEWLALPAADRATEHQAYMFAVKPQTKYKFNSRDPHKPIMEMLHFYIGKP
jgi:hypothetical protein